MDETAVSPQMANWSATNYGKTLKQPFGERNGRFENETAVSPRRQIRHNRSTLPFDGKNEVIYLKVASESVCRLFTKISKQIERLIFIFIKVHT